MCRCFPAGYPEYVAVSLDEQTGEFADVKPKVRLFEVARVAGCRSTSWQDYGKRLDWASWLLAFEKYALLAAALKQIKFAEAMQYKAVVVKVRRVLKCVWMRRLSGLF